MKFYDVTLPLPTSVNQNYEVGRNRKGGYLIRTKVYTDWIEQAGIFWRKQFAYGVKHQFEGRIKVVYAFVLNTEDHHIAFSSDISNREKGLSDFLERKFYLDDKQIDEQFHFRRLTTEGPHRVMARVLEIPDRRFEDPMLIFNPK